MVLMKWKIETIFSWIHEGPYEFLQAQKKQLSFLFKLKTASKNNQQIPVDQTVPCTQEALLLNFSLETKQSCQFRTFCIPLSKLHQFPPPPLHLSKVPL